MNNKKMNDVLTQVAYSLPTPFDDVELTLLEAKIIVCWHQRFYAAMGNTLGVNPDTVKKAAKNLFKKLGCTNQATLQALIKQYQLDVYLMQQGVSVLKKQHMKV